jgi:hypothetical protein
MNVNNWVDRGMFLASFACKNPLFLIFCRDSRRKERLDDLEGFLEFIRWSGYKSSKWVHEGNPKKNMPMQYYRITVFDKKSCQDWMVPRVSWNSSGGEAIKVRNESTKERQIPPKLGAHSGLPSFFAPYASDRASFFVPLSPTPVSFLRIALRLHGWLIPYTRNLFCGCSANKWHLRNLYLPVTRSVTYFIFHPNPIFLIIF